MQKNISIILFSISLFLLAAPFFRNMNRELLSHAPYLATGTYQTNAGTPWDGSDPAHPSEAPSFPAAERIPASRLGSSVAASTPSSLYAKACCVIDAESGRMLLGKNENERLPMASTTKIMTCILALESGKLSEAVEVSSYAASMPDVQLNIRAGEKYRLKDLLYSLMLESHNDTAVAIAEHLGGSVEGFAGMMNAKAKELSLSSTHFVTPNGLDHEEHYTTARELCILGAYALQNKAFQKIIQTSSYQFQELSGRRSFSVQNHDAFLSMYPGALGIKTGFTSKAGYCFCGAAKKGGRTIVSSVLACGWPPNKTYKWADTKKLMEYGFQGYKACPVPLSDQELSLPVANGQLTSVSLQRQTGTDGQSPVSLPLKASDTVTVTRQLPDSLTAPVRAGDIIGYENYDLNGECFRQVPLTAAEDAEAISWRSLFRLCIRQLLCPYNPPAQKWSSDKNS